MAQLMHSLPTCSLVAFHPDPTRLLLFSSAVDAAIRVWSLQDRSCLAMLTAHYSAVTSLTFSADGHSMLRWVISKSMQALGGKNQWVPRLRLQNRSDCFSLALAVTRSALSGTFRATRPQKLCQYLRYG